MTTNPVDWSELPDFQRQQRRANEAIAQAARQRFRFRLLGLFWAIRESWRAYRCFNQNSQNWIKQPCRCGWHPERT